MMGFSVLFSLMIVLIDTRTDCENLNCKVKMTHSVSV